MGWVVALWQPAGDPPGGGLTVEVVRHFDAVADMVGRDLVDLVAVDMPIGLAEAGPRACDREARRHLGPRRSSVFPAPVRAVLDCTTYPDALAAARARSGRGLPKQTWFLVPKIREVEAAARRLGTQLAEVHPELAFAALTGAPMAAPKRTSEGRQARLAALRAVFPTIDDVLDATLPAPGTGVDDVLDAVVLTWSARRLWRGEGRAVGGEVDATGLPMTIRW